MNTLGLAREIPVVWSGLVVTLVGCVLFLWPLRSVLSKFFGPLAGRWTSRGFALAWVFGAGLVALWCMLVAPCPVTITRAAVGGWLICFLAALNLAVLPAFYYIDKRRATKAGGRRIPEVALHALAAVGGAPGAWLGQVVFRHKTKKAQFRRVFWATGASSVVVFCGAAWLTLGF